MQRIKPAETSLEEFAVTERCARTIHVDQNKSAQREEEFDPEVAFRNEDIEPASILVPVRLVIVVEHEQQWRQRARAGKGADVRRLRLVALHCPRSCALERLAAPRPLTGYDSPPCCIPECCSGRT